MSRWRDLVEQIDKKQEKEEVAEYPSLEDLETDLRNTLDDIDVSFRERASKEKDRYAQACDSIYYFTVYFSNREQMIEFCEKFDMDYAQFFFDGREIARKFNRALKTADTSFQKTHPVSKDYVDRAMG